MAATQTQADHPLYLLVFKRILSPQSSFAGREMPERARHHHRSDAYAEYSRERDSAYYGDPSPYDDRGRNQKPRDVGERGPAGDRRAKHDRHRDLTTDNEPPAHRDNNHHHEGLSRL